MTTRSKITCEGSDLSHLLAIASGRNERMANAATCLAARCITGEPASEWEVEALIEALDDTYPTMAAHLRQIIAGRAKGGTP